MSILGSVGSLYMAILTLLLIIGFGLVGLKLINYVLNLEQILVKNNGAKTQNNNQETSKWLKIALYSFAGILLSIFILSVLNSSTINSSHM